MKCPACDEDAEGQFCQNCGARLTPAPCPQCEAPVAPGARFCSRCGNPVSKNAGRNRALPWVVAGALVTALAAALLVRVTSPSTAATSRATAPAPDISNLSPRERADRLFNRVMSAVEAGDTAQVNFFVPMALESYRLLGKLDPDARYHLGLILFVNHDFNGALAQADSITREVKGHLLADILRSQIATVRGDTTARNRAFRAYLAAYDREMAAGRPEYTDHQRLLEQMREQARQAVGR